MAGKWKGQSLKFSLNAKTRPTMSKVRAAFFSIVADRLHNAHFLDLFAGSGLMGLEAYSRGAKRIVFCEKDKELVKGLHRQIKFFLNDEATTHVDTRNAATIENKNLNENNDLNSGKNSFVNTSNDYFIDEYIAERLRVFGLDWRRALDKLNKERQSFHLIYADPPYFLYEKYGFIADFVTKVLNKNLLKPNGLLILELSKKTKIPVDMHCDMRVRDYGSTRMLFISEID